MANYDGGKADSTYSENAGMEGSYAMENNRADRIQLRRDHEEEWVDKDPVLAAGEIGLVIDKTYFKVGDNSNRWSQLRRYDFDVQIEQGTGTSTEAVMSQKAVTDAINTEKSRITQEITNRTTAINTEKTNRTDADTAIKNTMVKSCVSTDEAFNDVVKELYFDRFVDTSKISTIGIKRNGIAGGNIVWEMYIVDTDGKSSWASFGKKAEGYDVNVARLETQAGHFLSDKEVTVYAVIDWNKVPNNNGVGEETKHFPVRGKMLSTINNAKYFPKISECLENHKYTHSPVANSVIKELYFENLTKNGTPVSVYEFERYFSLQRIDRNKLSDDGSGKRVWSLVFYINNTDVDKSISGVKADNHFFEQFFVSPEKDVVLKFSTSAKLKYPDKDGVLTEYTFAATVYAVVDWSKLKNGEDTTIIAPLLSGCLDVRNSPIICEYIENEAIKRTVVKSCVSNNEEFNDIVKELYFDKYIESGDITKVSIFRKYTDGDNKIWGMDFTFKSGYESRASFSSDSTIESDDVCVATMKKENGTELKVYAVIRWGFVDNNSKKTYEPITLQHPTTDVKYHPTINQCLGTHRYSHTARGIKAIKELYIEDLKKNDVAVSKTDFEKYFKLESIALTSSGYYQMAFSDAREVKEGGTEFLYIVNYNKQYDENSVFYVDCIAKPLNPSINSVATGNKYSFKIYAVVDWSLMEQQTGGSYYYPINSNMLAGCLDKKNSPIIYNYIEINKLREESGLRPINE